MVSISNKLNIILNSFISEIFTSRCVFSIIFAASATFIEGALCPHLHLQPTHKLLRFLSNDSSQQPETTFTTFCSVCTVSPGLILSGE